MLGLGLVVMSTGMGTIMAPSTDAVMGAVPQAKAGVASATNDVARQVSGAVGVAVIGSTFNSAYEFQPVYNLVSVRRFYVEKGLWNNV